MYYCIEKKYTLHIFMHEIVKSNKQDAIYVVVVAAAIITSRYKGQLTDYVIIHISKLQMIHRQYRPNDGHTASAYHVVDTEE